MSALRCVTSKQRSTSRVCVSSRHVMWDAADVAKDTYDAPGSNQFDSDAITGQQRHHLGRPRQEDDGLLPHDAPVAVLHVVHLVEDDPRQLPQQLRTPVSAEWDNTLTTASFTLVLCTPQGRGDDATGLRSCCPATGVAMHTAYKNITHTSSMPGWLVEQASLPVQHGPQDLGGHDDAGGVGIDGHVARHQAHVAELLGELPVLLVAQRLRDLGCLTLRLGVRTR